MEAPTILRDSLSMTLRELMDASDDVLVRYPDGSCLRMAMERAAKICADEIGVKAIGREGFQLVLHRR